MKIMWVTNVPVGAMNSYLGKNGNGLWMDVLLNEFIGDEMHSLSIVTTSRNQNVIKFKNGNVNYYFLPGGYPFEYNPFNKKNECFWDEVVYEIQPDIIHIWGSEFKHSIYLLRAYNVPKVFYVQGIISKIFENYYAGISRFEIFRNITFRDIIRNDTIFHQRLRYKKQVKYENEIIFRTDNIICENNWCKQAILSVSPTANIHYLPLNISNIFLENQWSISDKHSIIMNASGYTIKGLHFVLDAISMLKIKYPDIVLKVPGRALDKNRGLNAFLRNTGYTKYILRKIKRKGLQKNVIFLGNLSHNELVNEMKNSRLFLLGSAVENHSSTLKEAMCLGMPCIASNVGGVSEYAIDGYNSLLYEFGNAQLLSELIEKLFESSDLSIELGKNARKQMLIDNNNNWIKSKLINIYRLITGIRT